MEQLFKLSKLQACKSRIGAKAASLIENGMIVGLGTGSTATFFIHHLGKRCREGLIISAVPSSQRSLDQAEKEKISLIDINKIDTIDITVDGADEIDLNKKMIKGKGGALLREKIIANMSREMIVIVDESKLTSKIGNIPLPVLILPFGYLATIEKICRLGYQGDLRLDQNGSPFITEDKFFIYDIKLEHHPDRPEECHKSIRSIPGVIETGFFPKAGRVILGYQDGRTVII